MTTWKLGATWEPVDGVAALLVLTGTMHLEVESEPERTVPAGSLAVSRPGARRGCRPQGRPSSPIWRAAAA